MKIEDKRIIGDSDTLIFCQNCTFELLSILTYK
jgi:hypothetical protein